MPLQKHKKNNNMKNISKMIPALAPSDNDFSFRYQVQVAVGFLPYIPTLRVLFFFGDYLNCCCVFMVLFLFFCFEFV